MNKSFPVFIAGCGRSGTTYLRTIIDAHPDIFIPTESLFLSDYLKYSRYVPKKILSYLFFNEPQLNSWYTGPIFNIENISNAITKIHLHAANIKGSKIWGQKTPRFVRDIELFNKHFDNNIKWILIYRDPRAVFASMLKSKRHTYSVFKACKRWIRDNKPIVDILQHHEAKDNFLIIQYESFVNNLEFFLEKIFDYLDVLPITIPEIKRKGTTPTLKGSRFEIITVREGLEPQKKFIDTWKKSLTPNQISQIETICFKEMKILGYTPISFPNVSKKYFFRKQYQFSIKDLLIFFEYIHKWPQYLFHTAIRKITFSFFYQIQKVRGK